jgi:hypothetical protein
MKKILFALLLVSTAAFSQEQKADKPAFKSSVVLKWNPESLAFGKISLGSEIHLWHKKGITFNVGLPAKQSKTFKLDDKDRDVNIKSTSFMAGYRMYLGKSDITGLYFEPYVKYVKSESSVADVDYTIGTPSRTAIFTISNDYKGYGVGAQLGVQFMIAKTIAFDLFLIGPEANSAKNELKAVETSAVIPWTNVEASDAKREVQDFVNDIPIIGKKMEITVDQANKTVRGNYSGFIPGFRAGLSVGIRF